MRGGRWTWAQATWHRGLLSRGWFVDIIRITGWNPLTSQSKRLVAAKIGTKSSCEPTSKHPEPGSWSCGMWQDFILLFLWNLQDFQFCNPINDPDDMTQNVASILTLEIYCWAFYSGSVSRTCCLRGWMPMFPRDMTSITSRSAKVWCSKMLS